MNMFEIVFFTGGFFLIILAFLFGKRLGDSKIDFNLSRIGIEFHADRLAIVLFLAVIMIGSGIYLRIKNYEDRLTSLANEAVTKENEKKMLDVSLKNISREFAKMRTYDLPVYLYFNEDVNPNSLIYEVSIKGENDDDYKMQEIQVNDDEPGTMSVNLRNLKMNDKIKIVARTNSNDRVWMARIEIPKTKVIMQPR